MENSLSNLINNLSEGIHKIKCKNEHNNKKNTKRVEMNTKILTAFLNTLTFGMIYKKIRMFKL